MLQMLSMLADVCFQLRILDVTEVFVLKYCPLCLNITSKSETEMFSINNQRQMFHYTCESRTVTQRVTKGHQIAVHLQLERRRLLTIKQRNQIIHRTIVDFTSMSYLNLSRSHKDNEFNNRRIFSQAPQNALLILDYC